MSGTAPPLGVVVTAAGTSSRFVTGKKELMKLPDGRFVLEAALSPFLDLPGLRALVVTAPEGREAELRAAAGGAAILLGDRLLVIAGGATRRDSVRLGLEALVTALAPGTVTAPAAPGTVTASAAPGTVTDPADEPFVLVHDGARPWASPRLAAAALAAARERGAAIPLIPPADTIKEKGLGDPGASASSVTVPVTVPAGLITGHPARSALGAAQTPQAFRFIPLLAAHRRALAEGVDCTDDAELWARYVGPVCWIEGEAANRKITLAADLPLATEPAAPVGLGAAGGMGSAAAGPSTGAGAAGGGAAAPGMAPESSPASSFRPKDRLPALRVGEGWDLHRLVAGRPLVLGGVRIPAEAGEEAWSDGDVLLHAAIDAFLGAAALGDIGTHFPPSEPRWKDAASTGLATHVAVLVRDAGWEPLNLDCTVVLERPRLGPHREAIRAGLAAAFGMDVERVSVKAKTSEGVDAAGEGLAIEARAVVLLACGALAR